MAVRGTVVNAFTVDTEEWFHVCGVEALAPRHWPDLPSRIELTTRLLLRDMDACGVRGTFLIVGWIAERYPHLVKEILAAGHEVGSHSHLHRRVRELTEKAFEEDLARSLRALADAGATRVRCFRAPEWSLDPAKAWTFDVLARAGIEIDSSLAPVKVVGSVTYPRHPHVRTTDNGWVLEMPPLVADRFGQVMPIGWGWGLRMSNPAKVARTVEHMNARGVPAVFMVHPWEIDPDPPRVPLPAGLRFAHYFRLSGFRDRLKRLMRLVPLGTLSESAASAGSVR